MNRCVLDYVNVVMSKLPSGIDPDERARAENDLLKKIIQSPSCKSLEDIILEFGCPTDCADRLNLTLRRTAKSTPAVSCGCPAPEPCRPPVVFGEYMHEDSRTNIKLLYIPLVQIDSGTNRLRMPLTNDRYY